jgi:hypothetical protein
LPGAGCWQWRATAGVFTIALACCCCDLLVSQCGRTGSPSLQRASFINSTAMATPPLLSPDQQRLAAGALIRGNRRTHTAVANTPLSAFVLQHLVSGLQRLLPHHYIIGPRSQPAGKGDARLGGLQATRRPLRVRHSLACFSNASR